jgi:hypothetical protein
VTSLGILANDVLDLREESDVNGSLASGSEEGLGKKGQREEERGFGGTLLAQLPGAHPASPVDLDERPCPVCTFNNPREVELCGMCSIPFP